MAIAARKQPTDTGAAADPAAVEAAVANAGPQTCPLRCGQDQSEIFSAALALLRMRPAEPGLEIEFVGQTGSLREWKA
jgi:hypothetical protein